MKRKIASIFLTLAMILSLIPGTVFAGEGTGDTLASLSDTIVDSGTFGEDGDNLTWSLSSNGTLTINGTGEMGYQTPWMSYRDSIKSLVVEKGVTTVGRSAFSGCDQLTSATLPTSLTEIGQSAFLGCFNLEKICLPDTLNAIGDNAFGSAWDTAFFFTGSEEQWNAVTIGSGNEPLENKKIHFNATYHTYDENGICTVCGYAGPDHTSHVMSVGYYYSEDGHWQVCIYCEKPMTETEEHVFDEDGICSVCGHAKVGHTHKMADWYYSDANGHWRVCKYCYEPMTETQGHSYDENGICTVCGSAGPDHTNHVKSDWYWNDETGHWKACIYCGEPMTETQGHSYDENGICTVCGYAGPDHTNHVMSGMYWNDETDHWKICIYCEKPMTETEEHVFDEDGICSVCGYARAGHTHQMADWYRSDVNGHWHGCKYCDEPMTETQGHSYDENGICTICEYAGPGHTNHVKSDWYWNDETGHWKACIYCGEPMTEIKEHVFDEDGICSTCGYARAGHTHKAAEDYGCDADGHWSICRFCGRQIGRVQAHDYAYSRCKVCGQYEADHVHSYAWLAEDSEHWQACEICYTAVNKGNHTFVNNVCEECGLLDPSLVPESIAVSINQNKQMTTVLTFTNGSSRELTITGIDILKGDEKNFSGVIYTKEGVLLGGDYWLLSNEAGQYTIGYKLYTDAKVLGNFVDSGEWVKLEELAKKQGIVAADCTYANGMWTVTGKAYDGQRAVMTLNDNLTVLNYTIGEDELVKTSGIVTVSDAKAKPGKTVTVKVDLSANKGISNMRLQMSYPEGFTLESIQKGDALSTLFFTPPGKLTANPVNFVWDGTEADMSEGCILELTFRIADTVAVGEYSISLSYQKDDVLDGSLEGIDLTLQSGTVSVVEFTRGDIDGDGVIGMKDLGALRKYFAGGYDTEKFVMEAADLDGDGVVTMKDLGVLRRYLAGGYDINLGE
ncbi:leucine-rich repeat protein [Vescimonas sp.]|uniref:leucine-rich repeat protein n=1 Tax=Vescimonas sp. TaxID=2892404 RepID=UPI00307B63AF